jgi:hypothetical protein
VLLEVLLRLPFDEFVVGVDVLLDLEELLDEFLEGSAVDVAELSNQDGVEDPQVPETLENGIRGEHLGCFEAIGLDATHEVAVG